VVVSVLIGLASGVSISSQVTADLRVARAEKPLPHGPPG